ncbi:MAG TPA: hypothetical protein VFV38_08605 [Ktedonobacteraceae bacterium]|nr:hypothetical protein [Ktedonobacteraceae bacterium]
MEVVYQRCASVDVHQRFLMVCLSIVEAGQRRKEIRSFRSSRNGKHRGLLDAGLSALGGVFRADCGQRAAYQGSARPKNRHTGR